MTRPQDGLLELFLFHLGFSKIIVVDADGLFSGILKKTLQELVCIHTLCALSLRRDEGLGDDYPLERLELSASRVRRSKITGPREVCAEWWDVAN